MKIEAAESNIHTPEAERKGAPSVASGSRHGKISRAPKYK